MRYAILGDIHANLTALETVLASIQSEGVDRILSVGDVVGYGAAPTEVVQIVRELDVVVVKGNHDAACVDELDTTYFNPYARAAVDWTREALDDARPFHLWNPSHDTSSGRHPAYPTRLGGCKQRRSGYSR